MVTYTPEFKVLSLALTLDLDHPTKYPVNYTLCSSFKPFQIILITYLWATMINQICELMPPNFPGTRFALPLGFVLVCFASQKVQGDNIMTDNQYRPHQLESRCGAAGNHPYLGSWERCTTFIHVIVRCVPTKLYK